MSDGQRPLRPPFFGGPSRRPPPGVPDGLTRELRDVYAVPDEPRYWDALESRIVAAVRDGAARATATTTGAFRAVPAVAVEWWHALARWAQPGLAAAGVAFVIAAAVFVDARATAAASRAHSAFRDVLDAPIGEIAPASVPGGTVEGASTLDAGLARAGDDAVSDDPVEQARAHRARLVGELLSGGLARHHLSAAERSVDQPAAHEAWRSRAHGSDRPRRDVTFPELLPDE